MQKLNWWDLIDILRLLQISITSGIWDHRKYNSWRLIDGQSYYCLWKIWGGVHESLQFIHPLEFDSNKNQKAESNCGERKYAEVWKKIPSWMNLHIWFQSVWFSVQWRIIKRLSSGFVNDTRRRMIRVAEFIQNVSFHSILFSNYLFVQW